jgi:hypothetical protein
VFAPIGRGAADAALATAAELGVPQMLVAADIKK